MRFMGLDPSLTATGICDPNGETSTWTPPKGTVGTARLSWFERQINQAMADATTAPNLVLLEGYAYGRANQAHQLGELGGVIRLALRKNHRFFVTVPPSTLKKYATGKGNASKEQVLVAAVLKSGREMTNDEADAWWLHQIGLAHYFPGGHHLKVDMPPDRFTAHATLDWPELDVLEGARVLPRDPECSNPANSTEGGA